MWVVAALRGFELLAWWGVGARIPSQACSDSKHWLVDGAHADGILADLRDIVAQNAMHTKLFLMHNKNDEVIPFWNHKALSKLLSDLGMDRVTSAVFEDGSHWFQEPGGMKAIVDFLRMAVGITDDMPEDS